jgi:hypothetical protein
MSRRKKRRGNPAPAFRPDSIVHELEHGPVATQDEWSMPTIVEVGPDLPPYVEIREPSTSSAEDITAIHLLLMCMGEECARAPVDPEKVLNQIVYAMANPDDHVVLMAVVDGRLAGSLCLAKNDLWYSSADPEFFDLWLYVLPKYRDDGHTFKNLLDAAAQIAAGAETPVNITINNPSRRRGSRTGEIERTAALFRFVPSGSVLRLESGAHVPRESETG